jgi:hypothetical protein
MGGRNGRSGRWPGQGGASLGDADAAPDGAGPERALDADDEYDEYDEYRAADGDDALDREDDAVDEYRGADEDDEYDGLPDEDEDGFDDEYDDDGPGHAEGEPDRAYPDEPGRRRLVPAFLLGTLAGLVVFAIVWGLLAQFTGDGNEPVADTGAPRGVVAKDDATSTQDGSDATQGQQPQAAQEPTSSQEGQLPRCRRADAELAVPLRAAASALSQWEVHVGAMNKLVVGAITLAQAQDFWNQTRVGAQRKLDRYFGAERGLRHRGIDCPPADRVPVGSPALASCASRVDADERAVTAARTALRTWAMHVEDMEMLRTGKLSPARASAMWLASWHHGVHQIDAYRSAARAVDRSGRC